MTDSVHEAFEAFKKQRQKSGHIGDLPFALFKAGYEHGLQVAALKCKSKADALYSQSLRKQHLQGAAVGIDLLADKLDTLRLESQQLPEEGDSRET